jgi:hypothetical protein
MAKWKYVGPTYGRGVLLRDGSWIFPNHQLDDTTIDTIVTKYPEIAPYWRLTDADDDGVPDDAQNGNGAAVDFTPLSNAIEAEKAKVQLLLDSIVPEV